MCDLLFVLSFGAEFATLDLNMFFLSIWRVKVELLKRVRSHIVDLVRSRRASPLLEEGMLIGLAVMTLTIIFSMVAGVLNGVQEVIQNVGFGTEDFMNALNDLWSNILAFLGIRG